MSMPLRHDTPSTACLATESPKIAQRPELPETAREPQNQGPSLTTARHLYRKKKAEITDCLCELCPFVLFVFTLGGRGGGGGGG